jgi:hypothetical protein
MRCVIYDPLDLEALTVINVPDYFLREIERRQRGSMLRFALPPEPLKWPKPEDLIDMLSIKTAEILFERFQYGSQTTWVGMAMNPEMALALKSEFLPGQQAEVWAEKRKSFLEGVTEAFKHL